MGAKAAQIERFGEGRRPPPREAFAWRRIPDLGRGCRSAVAGPRERDVKRAVRGIPVALCVSLCGCTDPARGRAEHRAADQQRCSDYGCREGTDAFADCMMRSGEKRESAEQRQEGAVRGAQGPPARAGPRAQGRRTLSRLRCHESGGGAGRGRILVRRGLPGPVVRCGANAYPGARSASGPARPSRDAPNEGGPDDSSDGTPRRRGRPRVSSS